MMDKLRRSALNFHQMAVAMLAISAPILGTKVVDFGPWKWTAGTVIAALVYTLVDVINERWGAWNAGATVAMSTVLRLTISLLLIPLIVALPTAYAPEGYNGFVGSALRVLLASEFSILVGNLLVDIPFFSWLKRRKNIGGFFVRTNVTNIVSAVISTTLFTTIAFAGVQPIGTLIVGNLVARFVFMFALSPLSTAWVWWMGRNDAADTR
jgi:queuosine precursor transporter